ncbi:MOSC domain-containing protein [Enterovirga rhinocerotis]|uniref:MOSC domain-containing protein n=1 Tax=Enterovirga rhinocerotis TaxID=1339210 RepID=A0A4R7CEY3_9HYPH|nr:MOSC domain-containing protein [Enterovirga rhinocerotis]TDR95892.1 hypothetical protein EV668_0006 [Enterovirga rhinocerotis]
MRVASLHRYPVKGLSPESRESFELEPRRYVPGDRLYAIENGPSGFDPAAPRHQPKIKFLMLMRNERLATLRTRYVDETTTLVIEEEGQEVLRADLSAEAGRSSVSAFFEGFMPAELRGPPRVLKAPDGFRFTDSRSGFISLLNLASVAALEERIGAPVDPLRFRANVAMEGLPAWTEFDWIGRSIRIGEEAVVTVTKRIVRCAATEVDPATGARDLDVVRTLQRNWDHADCGIYAEIVRPGRIRPGDAIEVMEPAQAELALA